MSGQARRRVVVTGAAGRMGETVSQAVMEAEDLELVARVDPAFAAAEPGSFVSLSEALQAGDADVVVDFTQPSAAAGNIELALEHGLAAVVGTTGLSETEVARLTQRTAERGGRVLLAPNFALGAVLMMLFAQQAARHFSACEVIELHHDRKLDRPSGTALRTGKLVEEVWSESGVAKDVPLHSVRLPGLVAHQEVIFGGEGEILTIRHDSLSRDSFMPGVLLAIRRIDAVQGFVVGLENIL